MNAVIYARYSSDNQREESIEGQLRECMEYAEKNDYDVIHQYIDRAYSAKTDERPAFQQMIRDSEKKCFAVVIVWKLDRFSRDRYDSAYYKHVLKKNSVILKSATETIAPGPDGILMESVLEGMAEYYSAELAIKVRRGLKENALKCRNNGGPVPLGYRVGKDHKLEIVPGTAAVVQEMFLRYDNGETLQEIADSLNARGLRTQNNCLFKVSSLGKILRNRKYIGEYRYDDTVIPDGMPRIVEQDIFDRVQKRMELNKRAAARGKAIEEYILTTKLFCGECGAPMTGDCGTSKTGAVHFYYKCNSRKQRKGCKSKSLKKQWFEKFVVDTVMRIVFCEEEMNRVADALLALQGKEDPAVGILEIELKDCERKLNNIMDAIMAGIHTETTKAKLEELELQKKELKNMILKARLQRPTYTKELILKWFCQFKNGDVADPKFRKRLIDIFVNSIYVFTDKIVFTFNFKKGTDTFYWKDILRIIRVQSSVAGELTSP